MQRYSVIIELLKTKDTHLADVSIMSCNYLPIRCVPELTSPLNSLVQLDLSNNLICNIEKMAGYDMPQLKRLFMGSFDFT